MAKDDKKNPAAPTQPTATAPSAPAPSAAAPIQTQPIEATDSGPGQASALPPFSANQGRVPASYGDRQPTGMDLATGEVPQGARNFDPRPIAVERSISAEDEARIRREVREELLAELEDRLADSPMAAVIRDLSAPRRPKVIKGKRTYVLTQPHYRNGRLYQAGEKITVVDEAPGRTWVPLEEHEAKLAKEREDSDIPPPDVLPGRAAQNVNDDEV
jgi:hypothetical protein